MAAEGSIVPNGGGDDQHGHMADDHQWMDESDNSIVAYCVRPCSGVGAGTSIIDVDPCGDGMGQSGFCTPVSLEDPAAFGFNDAVPDAWFLGCSHQVCAASCGTIDAPDDGKLPSSTLSDDGTVCFPRTDRMDGMYMGKDDAELSAVARGCSGSHAMGDMVMVGSTHPACASSYSKNGVMLGSFPEAGSNEDGYMHSDGHAHTGDHHDDHHNEDDIQEVDYLTTSFASEPIVINFTLLMSAALVATAGMV